MLPASLFRPPKQAPQGVAFRLARQEDLSALHAACYPHQRRPLFERHFRRLLKWQESDLGFFLVGMLDERHTGTSDGELVAGGQLVPFLSRGEIAGVSVTVPHQNQGIGTAVITILTNIAAYLGYELVEIGTAADNLAALALYRRLGFRDDRWVRTQNNGLAIILVKELNQPIR